MWHSYVPTNEDIPVTASRVFWVPDIRCLEVREGAAIVSVLVGQGAPFLPSPVITSTTHMKDFFAGYSLSALCLCEVSRSIQYILTDLGEMRSGLGQLVFRVDAILVIDILGSGRLRGSWGDKACEVSSLTRGTAHPFY